VFDDVRSVRLAVSGGATTHLVASAAGKITAFDCAMNATMRSGDTALSLDGTPLLAVATLSPLWRDLTIDTRGDDVRAFQNELSRLGYPVQADGAMGNATLQAAVNAFARIGVRLPPNMVPLSSLMWIPAAEAQISTCDVAVGADVQPGASLATFTRTSAKVTIMDLPKDLLPGARVIRSGASRFPVAADGQVEVPDVAALGITSDSESADGHPKPVEAELVLAEPLPVAIVAPGALYDVQGKDACVAEKGVPHRVRVLGSRLGEALVDFVGRTNPSIVSVALDRNPPCR